jgi:hypothetical protein
MGKFIGPMSYYQFLKKVYSVALFLLNLATFVYKTVPHFSVAPRNSTFPFTVLHFRLHQSLQPDTHPMLKQGGLTTINVIAEPIPVAMRPEA